MGQSISGQQASNIKHFIIALCLTAASAQRRGRQEALDAYASDAALDTYAADEAADPLAALAANIPECLEKTTLSLLRFLNLDSPVKAKLMEATMLTLRLSVKHSIFAQLMELEVLPSTAFSVLMEHSSTRTISSVIGGSTLTA